ncbi:uncharacterized protein [Procambarus clarkii]|uniref:uncharacterized protein n=1 Tax=Procambarus clarkii TaxID=6728 RepID=UPI001E6729DD|nr:uncharacterized protein LOC123755245 [Procambarus clarkii]
MAVWERKQKVSRVVREYVRFLVIGAFSTCAFLNLALQAGAGLQYYCQEECLIKILKAPISSMDTDVILHMRKYWVEEPAPRGSYKPVFALDNPPWALMNNWMEAYKVVNDYFKQYKVPGTFMEIGANDGEFQSMSLYVEQQLGFRGVLVEPDLRAYTRLRLLRRSAYTINACATPDYGHRMDQLWIRRTPANLPPLLYRLQKSNNKLLQYVSLDDRDLGRTVPVQCFNAGAMAVAALKTKVLDLLVISTHGGEIDILHTIPASVSFKMLVIITPIASEDDKDYLVKATDSRGLMPVFIKYNINIFLLKSLVVTKG